MLIRGRLCSFHARIIGQESKYLNAHMKGRIHGTARVRSLSGLHSRSGSSGKAVLWWCVLLGWMPGIGTALDRQPAVNSTVDQTSITVGDIVRLRLDVVRPDRTKSRLSPLQSQLGDWTVRQVRSIGTSDEKEGWRVDTFEVELSIYRTGEFEVPAIQVELTGTDGKPQILLSTPTRVKVQSVLQSGNETLRDLKPQAEIPPDYKPFILFLTALAAFSLVVYQVLRYLRKRRYSPAPTVFVDSRPPEQLAREAIGRLIEKRFVEHGLFKDFYLELSEIIKRYLGIKLGVLSLERTTEEFTADLKSTAISHEGYRRINDFLMDCDLVKFARYRPSREEVGRIVEMAYRIIDYSGNQPAETPQAQEALR